MSLEGDPFGRRDENDPGWRRALRNPVIPITAVALAAAGVVFAFSGGAEKAKKAVDSVRSLVGDEAPRQSEFEKRAALMERQGYIEIASHEGSGSAPLTTPLSKKVSVTAIYEKGPDDSVTFYLTDERGAPLASIEEEDGGGTGAGSIGAVDGVSLRDATGITAEGASDETDWKAYIVPEDPEAPIG